MIAAIELDDTFHGVLLAAVGNDELRLRAHDLPVSDRLPGRAELLFPASVPQSLILVTMADEAPTRADDLCDRSPSGAGGTSGTESAIWVV